VGSSEGLGDVKLNFLGWTGFAANATTTGVAFVGSVPVEDFYREGFPPILGADGVFVDVVGQAIDYVEDFPAGGVAGEFYFFAGLGGAGLVFVPGLVSEGEVSY
jgi:hypothetical protein